MDIYELMKQVNEWVKEILQDNYVGVYFHGSLRLGSFNANKSVQDTNASAFDVDRWANGKYSDFVNNKNQTNKTLQTITA